MTAETPTVAVVEDERELADTYARWLRDDYTVRTAYTAEEALEVIDEAVDAVLLDRRLPDRSGSAVLDEIRAAGFGCSVAIITAVDPDFDIVEMGFDDYVVKPVLKDDLRAMVDRLVRIATYDAHFRESFGLASKLTVLENEKADEELDRSDEYARLEARFTAIQDEIESTLDAFDDDDFSTAYRSLRRDHTPDRED